MTVMGNDPSTKVARSIELSNKVAKTFQTRAQLAQERFSGRIQKSFNEQTREGLRPVLHLAYEMVVDGRTLAQRGPGRGA